MHSGNSLEVTSVKGQLRGLIGLQCVFVYCMSWKTWIPKSLGFRGDSGDLAPFPWGLLWAVRLFQMEEEAVSTTSLWRHSAEESLLPDFHHHGFPFPFFSFPDVLTLKTHRSQNQHQPSMSVATKA
ncbi:unnamed protein product [Pipistrellus nathusii]|uniref:Uncharacterized protein n=1 Tax=Pipistrellus nathusii TaxID=59473 RepID=A0ABP0A629_PIPNA